MSKLLKMISVTHAGPSLDPLLNIAILCGLGLLASLLLMIFDPALSAICFCP
jgi:hypothetical protein